MKAAGLDNAGSKWSREAQTKFVPRGLRQGSIINESQQYHEIRDLSHTLPLGGKLRFEMTDACMNSFRCTMFRSSLFKKRDSVFVCIVEV
ncbi:MAG: hypothetical protein IKJ23_05370 [Bacteroidaceae bacterium]|nr:hypothetical protein [Bacteroidaceae bacterium]